MARFFRMCTGAGLVALACAGALSASPQRASAQGARRVVVQQFSGPRGSTSRAALVRSLEENGVVVLEDDEVRAARERLGLGTRIRGEQYVALGRELNVSAFVDGRVARRRRAWSLTVRVRNAADGEELGSATWGGRTAASLGGVRRNGYDRLREHLESARAPGAAAQTVPEGETPWWARGADQEAPPEPEPPEPAPERPRSTRYDVFRISIVGGTLFRSMDTMVDVYAAQRRMMPPDPATALLTETRRYQSGGIGHFELGGEAELYPGAIGDQPFPYLGAVVSFTHSIGVQSNGVNRLDGQPVAVPTNQLDFFAGLRGRYRFGPDRREPEIRIDAGYGMFQFDLGLEQLQLITPDTIIPPMQHGYLQLGAGISYGIVPTYLTAAVDFAYRIGTNSGGDMRNVWGTETPPSNGFTLGLELKTEIPEIVEGFFLALRVRYFQFTTNFEGQVGCADADECAGYMDPWSDTRLWEPWPVRPPSGGMIDLDDVVGGPQGDVTDHYVRLQLAVGYAFF